MIIRILVTNPCHKELVLIYEPARKDHLIITELLLASYLTAHAHNSLDLDSTEMKAQRLL